MNTEQLITKGVERHFNGQEVLFKVESLKKHFDGLLIHETDVISVLEELDDENPAVAVEYIKQRDVNFDNATAKELVTEEETPEPTGMTFEQALKEAEIGELIALPEWEGFWFVDIKTGLLSVLTKENEILDTPSEEFKTRNDWKIVQASPLQVSILEKHYQEPVQDPIVHTPVIDEETTDSETLDVNEAAGEEERKFDENSFSVKSETLIEKQLLKADYVEVPADAVEEVKKEEEETIPAELPKEEIAAPVAETPAPKAAKAPKSTTKK